MPEKIVVTGMGTVNGLGLTVKETWQNIVDCVSGVAPITLFDAKDFLVQIACEVKHFQPENYMQPKEVRRRDRFEQFAAAASQEAIRQSGLGITEEDKDRVGVVIASGIGGLKTILETVLILENEGPRRVSPFAIPMIMPNGAAGLISIDNGFHGPSFTVGSACASGADAIGLAWTLLRSGVIDVAIAGASEATVTSIGVGAFDRTGAMAHRPVDWNNPSQKFNVPQPFDKNRDGLVMGEGAAILVIERESHARRRGAEILAELAGYGATADAFHVTAPDENGAGGARAIRLALELAGVNPEEVDYINAHGTATTLNDISETKAIKAAYGKHAYDIPVSSTKSMTGHMMGTTAALEAIFCVQSILTNTIPATINYQTPDPDCDLDIVPNEPRSKPVNIAVSNAFGFGGHNAVLVIRKYQ